MQNAVYTKLLTDSDMSTSKKLHSQWQTTSSKIVYKNPWITVREDQVIRADGTPGLYGVVEVKPSVFIVAFTAENKVLFIQQFRYTNGQMSWEIPAGGCELDDPLVAAKRELQEETGFSASEWQAVGSFYPNNGISTEKSFVFVARDLIPTGKNEMREEGITQVREFSLLEVDQMLLSGELNDGQVISSLALARLHLQQKN